MKPLFIHPAQNDARALLLRSVRLNQRHWPWIAETLKLGQSSEPCPRAEPWNVLPVYAKLNGSALMVIVETVEAALAKLAEFTDLGHAEVVVRDLLGKVIDPSILQNESP